jgi:hypothetical protein
MLFWCMNGGVAGPRVEAAPVILQLLGRWVAKYLFDVPNGKWLIALEACGLLASVVVAVVISSSR